MQADWIRSLETNRHGRPILTENGARKLAMLGEAAGQWYVAPFAMRWTVGKFGDEYVSRLHVLDERGEPLCFFDEGEAKRYLERELNVPKELVVNLGANPLMLELPGQRALRQRTA